MIPKSVLTVEQVAALDAAEAANTVAPRILVPLDTEHDGKLLLSDNALRSWVKIYETDADVLERAAALQTATRQELVTRLMIARDRKVAAALALGNVSVADDLMGFDIPT